MYMSAAASLHRFLCRFVRRFPGSFRTQRLSILASQTHCLFIDWVVVEDTVDFVQPVSPRRDRFLYPLFQPRQICFKCCNARFNFRYSHSVSPLSILTFPSPGGIRMQTTHDTRGSVFGAAM